MTLDNFSLLKTIKSPKNLRNLPEDKLSALVLELREFLITSIAKSGGHFGAGLGCIELTVALHYVFNTPDDKLVWDVGHQAYPHKILTERAQLIESIKKRNGLAPFPCRKESKYDAFGVGHSSTSISAALGMAIANKLNNNPQKVVAIIGDGGLTAGLAYEALHHGGDLDNDLIVVLNENQMSISPNVGGISKMLGRLTSGNIYTGFRENTKKYVKKGTKLRKALSRWKDSIKGLVVPSTLFEELGFHYSGPIDGHDLPLLVKTLTTLKQLKGPQLLHIITEKGKGYAPAESDPINYHAVSPFDPIQGVVKSSASKPKTYTNVFGEWLCDMAAKDKSLVAITPAMREGSGLVNFAKHYPKRYFDVGIAEQHSVTLAAGMACAGIKPVVAIYSTFLQRAYDQLIHDVALQNLPILFAIDRAGLVGPDGPTHAGSYDLSYLRCIPNMVIMAPANENEARQMLYTGFLHDGPAAVRYPRGSGPGVIIDQKMQSLPIGKAEVLLKGQGIVILAFGSMVYPTLSAGKKLNATVVNMKFIKPLDQQLIIDLALKNDLMVTVEENAIAGGAGSAINELLANELINIDTLNIGLPDEFVEHGNREELLKELGLSDTGIKIKINNYIKQKYAPEKQEINR